MIILSEDSLQISIDRDVYSRAGVKSDMYHAISTARMAVTFVIHREKVKRFVY